MSRINCVNFYGHGTESTGSIANRNNNVNGQGTESTGSIANKNNYLSQAAINFNGFGSESTGSIANSLDPKNCPNCGDTVCFKGRENGDNKTAKTLGIIAGLTLLAAGSVAGLGYATKTKAFEKLNDGNILKKLEPASKKCYEWCSSIKTKGNELLDKIKNFFKSKKS